MPRTSRSMTAAERRPPVHDMTSVLHPIALGAPAARFTSPAVLAISCGRPGPGGGPEPALASRNQADDGVGGLRIRGDAAPPRPVPAVARPRHPPGAAT